MDSLASSQLLSAQQHLQSADVYTDLNSLQQLKATEDKDVAMRKVAQQFESMFLSMMLKSMRDANAVFEKDSMFNSGEVKFYRDMHDQQLTLTLAHSKNGGVGIADAMYRQLSQSHGSPELPAGGMAALPDKIASQVQPAKPEMAFAQSPDDFIRKVTPVMKKAAEKLGLDPDLLVAQAALETGWGKFIITDEKGNSSYNLFNIKAGKDWQGKKVDMAAMEFSAGTFKPETSSFRAYSSIEQSVNDYVEFVRTHPRYQQALKSVDDAGNYIRELHKAGYATDPAYADKVLSVRERLHKSET